LAHLVEPPGENCTSTETRFQVRAHQIDRQPRPDDLRPNAHDVDVVVLDRLVCGVPIVTDRCADPRDLVGGDRCPHPSAADQHRPVGASLEYGLAHSLGDIWKVHRRAIIRPVVGHLVTEIPDSADDHGLERKPRMISTDCDSHAASLPSFADPRRDGALGLRTEAVGVSLI